MVDASLMMVNINNKMKKPDLLKLAKLLQGNLKSVSQDDERSDKDVSSDNSINKNLSPGVQSVNNGINNNNNNNNNNYDDSSLYKKIEELEDRLLEAENRLYDAEVTLNKTDQYTRRENLEIAGVPESVSQEQLENYVLGILSAIDVKTDSYHVAGCHRLIKNKNQDTANVIIRFTNRRVVYEALLNKYKLGNTEIKEKLDIINNIYLSENLPANDDIFKACRRLKKFNKIQKVISRNGNIKILLNNSNRYKTIYHMNDIYYYVDGVDGILNHYQN